MMVSKRKSKGRSVSSGPVPRYWNYKPAKSPMKPQLDDIFEYNGVPSGLLFDSVERDRKSIKRKTGRYPSDYALVKKHADKISRSLHGRSFRWDDDVIKSGALFIKKRRSYEKNIGRKDKAWYK